MTLDPLDTLESLDPTVTIHFDRDSGYTPIPYRSQTESMPTPHRPQTEPKPTPNLSKSSLKPIPNRSQVDPIPTPNRSQLRIRQSLVSHVDGSVGVFQKRLNVDSFFPPKLQKRLNVDRFSLLKLQNRLNFDRFFCVFVLSNKQ
jgi:hypothetical protein